MPNERKNATWSQKKIEKLIKLYAAEECLWNPFNENYKNKVKRNKAMDKICKEIDVEPKLFLKKVHNLRNQFNSEYKKLERCLEEAEMLGQKLCWSSKWVHFDALMFLKDVIVRMPALPPPPTPNAKKIILEAAANNADGDFNAEYNDAIEIDEDGYNDDRKIEEDFQHLTSNEEILHTTNKKLSNMPTTALQLKKTPQDLKENAQQQTQQAAGLQLELPQMNTLVNLTAEKSSLQTATVQQFDLHPQDQWSAFGAFVANEMRNYQTDLSRRKLKRKIMQAMLEVAEEDEVLN